MTALDTAINAALDSLSIKKYPCIITANGKIEVKDVSSVLNAIILTYSKFTTLDNGMRRVTSGFYFFSKMKNDIDVWEDINPKMDVLATAVENFIKKMKASKFKITQIGEAEAEHLQTTGFETGFSFTLTFEAFPSVFNGQPC